jgi:cytochrome d ubiquinol oxidase subunit II
MLISWIVYLQFLKSGKYEKMVYVSSVLSGATVLTVALASFPVFIRSTINPEYSLTVFNSASSELTLKVMLIVTIIFMPLVIYYTRYAYKVFAGKVKGDTNYYH